MHSFECLFLKYGWPTNNCSTQLRHSTLRNHPSALAFADHVRHCIATELSFDAIAGPFSDNPLPQPLVCSPLQTVPKRGSSKRRVVMDLSYPPFSSVNSGIPSTTYLDSPFKLRLPGIDRLCEFILSKGRGCYLYKKDLQRAYRQLPIDPKDYHLLGFKFDNHLYFDTRCPFGLRSSAMICQRTTKAVIYIFTQSNFSADVYLDDFYGAEIPALAHTAFAALGILYDSLGLASSPEKDSPPATEMVCLGSLVNSEDLTLRVPDARLRELSDELHLWLSREQFTIKDLQSLLGKLSFVTACVHASRIFLSHLLNALRRFPPHAKHQPVTLEMRQDLWWWKTFLPLFNGVSVIKPAEWLFDNLRFTTDACMVRGGATCLSQCLTFAFPHFVCSAATHISALELFTIIVAVKFWAPMLQHQRFLISCDNEAAVTVIN